MPETSFPCLIFSIYWSFIMSKTTALMFRVTEDEKQALQKLAEKLGITISELMRRIARETISHGPSFFTFEHKAVSAMTRQLSALGRNINQIARRVNSGQCQADPLSQGQISELKTTVAEARAILISVLDNSRSRRVILRKTGRGKNL